MSTPLTPLAFPCCRAKAPQKHRTLSESCPGGSRCRGPSAFAEFALFPGICRAGTNQLQTPQSDGARGRASRRTRMGRDKRYSWCL
jgi:hypothetical protein